MNRKLKLVLAALLGFSAACSSVKNALQESRNKQESDGGVVRIDKEDDRRVIAMYGVRTPTAKWKMQPSGGDSLKVAPAKQYPTELDPVAEKIED